MEDLFPAFKDTREGQGILLALATYQVTLLHSNEYALVGYVGEDFLGPDNRS